MRVHMIETSRGAVDRAGTIVHQHVAGEVYDLPDFLALAYLGGNLAVREELYVAPSETQATGPSEVKDPAPEISSEQPAQEHVHRGGWPKGRPRK